MSETLFAKSGQKNMVCSEALNQSYPEYHRQKHLMSKA